MITHASNSVAASIAPMLSVRRGAAAVEFYKTAFGATEGLSRRGSSRRGRLAAVS